MASIAVVRPHLPEITPEAFLSLQQSQTFYGTPSNLPEIEPGDPRLDDPNQCLRPPHVPLSPLSVALNDRGSNSKASRYDACGSRRYYQCDKNPDHLEFDARTCRMRCCSGCADPLAEEHLSKFWSNIHYMRKLRSFWTMTLQSGFFEEIPTREQFIDFQKSLSTWVTTFCDPRPGTGASTHSEIQSASWFDDQGKEHPRYIIGVRIFWWGELHPEMFSRENILGQMTRTEHHADHLNHTIHAFFHYRPERDPETAAQIEIVTSRLKTIRHFGQVLNKEVLAEEERMNAKAELLANEPDMASNSETHPATGPRCCKKCGSAMSLVSEWVAPGTPVSELANIRWYKVDSPPAG